MAKKKKSSKTKRQKKSSSSVVSTEPDVPHMPQELHEITIEVDGQSDTLTIPIQKIPKVLPVLPIRGTVMFPSTVIPLGVGRDKSKLMLDKSLPKSKIIVLLTQRDEDDEDPSIKDLYHIGVAVSVLKMIRQPDDTLSIIAHGLSRVKVKKFTKTKPFYEAQVTTLKDKEGGGKRFKAGIAQLRQQARQLIELSPNAPEQAVTVLMNIDASSNLADFLAANLNLDVEQKQDLLEELDVAKRIRTVHQYVSNQLEIIKLQHKIQDDVQSSIGDSQRRMYLREQLKAIQNELAEENGGADPAIAALRDKIQNANMPEHVLGEASRELERLEMIPPASPEYATILSYLELLAELPWSVASKDNLDLDRARKVLDRDHFGLKKIKRRLIEYLAVRKLNPKRRGPILCLVGPPGVGKTSLGQSIANALGRKFARLSLGGIRDEAEVRGHRRTYIGAMPGRIIQEIRRAGTNNPVMMLDEIDKLGADFRGDPASALLEVLDPKQNHGFVDRYLDVPFDLSQVIFIATANYADAIPGPLYDRMEVIEIAGYTDNDKLQIARRYLVPRQIKENGLTRKWVKWSIPAMRKVIADYTREAGVRELERQIGAVCRGIAAKVAKVKRKSTRVRDVDEKVVRKILGPEHVTHELATRTKLPGIVIGLAYTPVGGEILFIEAASYPGKGQIILTGQIGDVMRESASAAISLFKNRAEQYQYDATVLNEMDLHIHVPAGAIPKDGPSAGIGMYTAVASLALDLPVQPLLAMTGEVTLRGLVLPIGGVKEKTLAAARAGIKTILLPMENKRDEEEIELEVRKKCKLIYVENVQQVLELALGKDKLAKVTRANAKKQKEQAKQKKNTE